MRRVLLERLTEPLHLNLLAVGAGLFGTFRQRVNCDLVVRQHNAYSISTASPSSNSASPQARVSSTCARSLRA
jgi:hypothetical protein